MAPSAATPSNRPNAFLVRRLLKEAEVAKRLNVSIRTLQTWRVRGGGPPFLKLGASVRYDGSVLESWEAGRVRSSTSDPGPQAT
jgi:DNA-binding transcriptional regulator YiaG